MGSILRVDKRPASEEEIEAALLRILGTRNSVWVADDLVRVLQSPAHGFEIKDTGGQAVCVAELSKIVRELDLQIGLMIERGSAKFMFFNVREQRRAE